MNLMKVKEVKEIYAEEVEHYQEINSLIETAWILIKIVPYADGLLFVLGRL